MAHQADRRLLDDAIQNLEIFEFALESNLFSFCMLVCVFSGRREACFRVRALVYAAAAAAVAAAAVAAAAVAAAVCTFFFAVRRPNECAGVAEYCKRIMSAGGLMSS